MKKWLRIGALVLVFILIVLQFFPGQKPEVIMDNPGDIHNHVEVGITVGETLRSACYDCHSNETEYPWYEKVVPVSWWLNHHIEEGRSELNFSVWDTYPEKRKHHKLEELIEMVDESEMPLNSYVWMHEKADLTGHEREELISWAKNYMSQLNPE